MASKQVVADIPQRTRRTITAAIVCMILVVCGGIASGRGQAASTRSVAAVERLDNPVPPTMRLAGQSSSPAFNERDPKRPGVGGRRLGSSPAAVCGEANLSELTRLVYVSPEGVDGATCGIATATACKTVQQGINNCAGSGCGVLVRYGLYPLSATIQITDGVSVYGSCVFDNSTREPYRTMLQAPPDGKPAITASGINTATTLYGFVVLGSDATTPGQASIAMTVSSSKGLTISHTVLAAGKGADGTQGVTPARAGTGADGNSFAFGEGGNACPSESTTGAGKGGNGGPDQKFSTSGCFLACVCTPTNSGVGAVGIDSATIKGGQGGQAGGKGCGCTPGPGNNGVPDGHHGDPGSTGNCSTQGGAANPNVWGTFSATKWSSVAGGNGEAGEVGSGGGGGGAGGIAALARLFQSPLTFPGLSGGGGGGGGCGGKGGGGGHQGGASIPLVVVASTLTLIQNSYVPGLGGRGGTGGQGGVGGTGGNGGPGSVGHFTEINQVDFCLARVPGSGGQGGNGGDGGAGAGGAGGNGGPSIGIALVEGSPPPPNDIGIYAGSPGTPGSQGKGGQSAPQQCQGADGSDGVTGGTGPWHSF